MRVNVNTPQETSLEAIMEQVPPVCLGQLDTRTKHALLLRDSGLDGEAFEQAMRQFDRKALTVKERCYE